MNYLLIRNDGRAFVRETYDPIDRSITCTWAPRHQATPINTLKPPLMDGSLYREIPIMAEIDVAMCMWEAFLDTRDHFQEFLDRNGTASARDSIAYSIYFTEAVWQHVDGEDGAFGEYGCFDWDFCPLLLKEFFNSKTLAPLHDIPTTVGLFKKLLTGESIPS